MGRCGRNVHNDSGIIETTQLQVEEVTSDLIPDDDNAYDLGTSTMQWAEVNAVNVIGDALKLDDGTNVAPSLAFSSDTNTGLYRVGADSIGFSAGGTQKATINSTGLTVASGQLIIPEGNGTVPIIANATLPDSGIYFFGDSTYVMGNGADVASIDSNGLTFYTGDDCAISTSGGGSLRLLSSTGDVKFVGNITGVSTIETGSISSTLSSISFDDKSIADIDTATVDHVDARSLESTATTVTAPASAPTTFILWAGGGDLERGHQYHWVYTYYTKNGETTISPADGAGLSGTGTGRMDLTITVSADSNVIGRRVYRSLKDAIAGPFYLTIDVTNNTQTLVTDTNSDATISANATSPDVNTTDIGIFNSAGDMVISAPTSNVVKILRTLRGVDGSASEPVYSFVDDTDTGMYLAAAGELALSVAGAEALKLEADTQTFSLDGSAAMTLTENTLTFPTSLGITTSSGDITFSPSTRIVRLGANSFIVNSGVVNTTDATQTTIISFTVPSGQVATVTARVGGRTTTDSVSWFQNNRFMNNAGTITTGGPFNQSISTPAPLGSVSFGASTSGSTVNYTVQGIAATNMSWFGTISVDLF